MFKYVILPLREGVQPIQRFANQRLRYLSATLIDGSVRINTQVVETRMDMVKGNPKETTVSMLTAYVQMIPSVHRYPPDNPKAHFIGTVTEGNNDYHIFVWER